MIDHGDKPTIPAGGPSRWWIGPAVSLLTILLFDVAVGVLFCRDGYFVVRLPPYDLVFTEAQRASLERAPTYGRFDAQLGWSIRPGSVAEDDDGAVANSAGIRGDREYALEPTAERVRIAIFGESFTHGAVVRNDETWPALLQSELPRAEVINFGVSGYGTDQTLLRYRRDGAPYRPQVVVVGFMLENTLRNVSIYRPAYSHGAGSAAVKPRFLLGADGELVLVPVPVGSREELRQSIEDGSLLPGLLEHDYWVRRAPLAYEGSWIFNSSFARVFYGMWEQSGRDVRRYLTDPESEPYRVTRRILTSFRDEAVADGAEQFLLVVIPCPECLTDRMEDDSSSPIWSGFLAELAAEGLEIVDVTPQVVAAARAEGLESLYSDAGGHYNARGNAIVARQVAELLGPQLAVRVGGAEDAARESVEHQ